MSALRMFIPITKVDAAQRLVYGLATAEIEDRAGEICDYESTKPLYEQWSAEIAKSTGGKSCGNLRAMHGSVAAGKVTSLTFNDAKKQIEICAKVVDDGEWAKVEEGVYTGFSQGGAYAKRWTDSDGRARYTARPSEVSLVDLPCLPQSRFELIKVDGSHEWRSFATGAGDLARLAALVDELDWLQKSATIETNATTNSDQLKQLAGRAAARLRTWVAEEAPPAAAAAGTSVAKIGARNSESDLERIQRMHDTSVDLGASCPAQKAAGFGLDKRFDALAATLADVLARVKNIEDQPMPLPLAGRAHAVSKRDDTGGVPGAAEAIEKLIGDPEALSLLAIKLAQRNGRSLGHG